MKLLVSFLLILSLISPALCASAAEETASVPVLARGTETVAAPENPSLLLPCRGAVLIEQNSGTVLFESNADEALPIASVTKIMTLLLTMEALDAGILHLDQEVPISETAASMGGSQVFLEPGEKITLNDVLKAVFVSSANDGAVALAELVSGSVEGFVEKMNARAAELGMEHTEFFNPTGLDDQETNLSSARDVALMSKALLSHQKIYEYTTLWIDSIRNGAFGLTNTNKLIRFYPGATGLKTGSTGKAKYCVSASAERNGLKLCAVVLGGESSADRFNAAKTMLDYGFANYAYFQPEPYPGTPVPVWGGTLSEVKTEADCAGILLPKKDAVGLQAKIELAAELTAPVQKGAEIGSITYEKEGEAIHRVPILAAEEVPKLSFSQIFLHLIRSAFGA